MSEYDNYEKLGVEGKLNQVFKKLLKLERQQAEIMGLFTYQTPTETASTRKPESPIQPIDEPQIEDHVDVGPPPKDDLIKAGVDFELVEYLAGGLRVEPVKFLGDLWGDVNQKLKAFNYKWVSAGKESHWKFQPTGGKKTETMETRSEGGAIVPVFEVGKYVTVEGIMVDDPKYKDFDRKDGTTGSVVNFRLKLDDDSVVGVGLFDEKNTKAIDFPKGTRVHLTSMKVKEPYKDTPQVNSAQYTKVTKVPSR